MPEYDLLDQAILVAMWVGLLYGLFGLALAWLALTNLEWRWAIKARLRAELRGFNLRFALAVLTLSSLTARGCRWLQGNRAR
jgi:gamma-glutamylcysteine synthetase